MFTDFAPILVFFFPSLFCLLGVLWGETPHAEEDDIPVVGRPVDLPFSEASGWFEVQARAEPTTVQAEAPFTFTLIVRAVRPVRRPPQRLDLRQLPDFAASFFLEDSNEGVIRPDDRTWEFNYRLKPRHTDVRQIPSVPFVYFNPYLLTDRKGFQVLYTDPIPIRVLPHESIPVPVQGPERAFVLATGPAVLERQRPWKPPSLGIVAVLLLVPPLGCLVWYLLWQRLYPDAARLASQRRSRAARRALHALHMTQRGEAKVYAAQMATAVVEYFHQRFDWAIAEPTPREVALWFTQHGFSAMLTEQAVRFFEACDRIRFLPSEGENDIAPVELYNAAIRLILAMEEETCSLLRS